MARRRASSRVCAAAVAVELLATSATSQPAHGPPARRAASRNTRFARFRVTAPPIPLPATKRTRPHGSRSTGVLIANTNSAGWDARRPPANSRSISACAVIVNIAAPEGVGRPYAALGQSTLRPLRRRAARIARPAFVDIRLRKPCVLARFRLLGWYVRFTLILRIHTRHWSGHKPGDYSDAPWCVSTQHSACASPLDRFGPQDRRIASRRLWNPPREVCKLQRAEKVQNLWTMWKTQELSVSRLWITI